MSVPGSGHTWAATVASNGAALALSKVFTSSLLLLWQVAIGRTLGSASYGIYGTIGAMMAVGGAMADLGTGPIAVRSMARHPSQAGRYLAAALAVQSGLALVAYGVLQSAGFALGYDDGLRTLLLFVGINLVVDTAGTAAHNRLVAAERMWWTGGVGSAHVVLLVTLGSVALALGGGLWAVYVAMLVAGVARAVLYWIALGRAGVAPVVPIEIDRGIARRLLTDGLPLGVAAILSMAFLHADKLATTVLLGTETTGQLTAAFVVVFGLVEVLGGTTLVAALPGMSRDETGHDLSASQPMLESLLFFNVLLGLPAAVLLAAFGGDLVRLLFGASFAVGGVLEVMAWCVLVRMIEGALAQALIVRDRQAHVLAARAVGLALNLMLTLTLLPRIGVVGAAIGMLAGELTIVAGMLRLLSPPRGWWLRVGRRGGRLAVPGAALGLCVVVLMPRLPAAASALAALLVYAVAAVAGGAVTREHLRLLIDATSFRSRS